RAACEEQPGAVGFPAVHWQVGFAAPGTRGVRAFASPGASRPYELPVAREWQSSPPARSQVVLRSRSTLGVWALTSPGASRHPLQRGTLGCPPLRRLGPLGR